MKTRRPARPRSVLDRRREPPPSDVVDFAQLAKLRRLLAAPQWQRRLAELAEADPQTSTPEPERGQV